MKKLSLLMFVLMTISCGENKSKESSESDKNVVAFPKYDNIIDMLKASNDYTENNLEELVADKNTPHIRVSSEFLNTEEENSIKEQVKRDVVYVVFQTFAQTSLNNISITATPITRTSFNPNLEYDGKLLETLSETVNVSRAKAEELLKKYLNNSSFEDLYDIEGTLYLPNDSFDKLKYDELDNVFLDLKK